MIKVSLDPHFKHIYSSLFNAVGLIKPNRDHHTVEITSANIYRTNRAHTHTFETVPSLQDEEVEIALPGHTQESGYRPGPD